MQGYKEPGFQDRMKAAHQERAKAERAVSQAARAAVLPIFVIKAVEAERAPTEHDRKAARDARYAARKARRK